MKVFSERERTVIEWLDKHQTTATIAIKDFLQDQFFNQANKRCLIIQPADKYAMFFLGTERYGDNKQKSKDIEELFELMALLNYLNHEGYITLFRSEHNNHDKMFFFSDEFDKPSIENNKLILNQNGLHSTKPESIKNSDDEVIYKGVEFKNSNFDLIYQNSVGYMCINKAISKLLTKQEPNNTQGLYVGQQENTNQSASRFSHADRIQLLFASVILVILSGISTYLFINIANMNRGIDKLEQLNGLINKSFQDKKSTALHSVSNKHYGIDVSHWNGDLLNELPKLPNIEFIICKATQGTSIVDDMFTHNWKLITQAKRIKGAYHFYVVNEDPIAQAEHFWAQIKNLSPHDLAPIVDIERANTQPHKPLDKLELQMDLLAFLHKLELLANRKPMIYTSTAFANTYITSERFNQYPLWLADYTDKSQPEIPVVWQQTGFKIWQRSESYHIQSQVADLDIYLGDINKLVSKL